ncbi:hypothetical protein AAG570_007320 [Ranatra chinensis]|uniref:Uncharacterized protein n=1 Tax=Ranatra chinensis TaxID=642074 RepID=A0ABD0YHB1_9HEMI
MFDGGVFDRRAYGENLPPGTDTLQSDLPHSPGEGQEDLRNAGGTEPGTPSGRTELQRGRLLFGMSPGRECALPDTPVWANQSQCERHYRYTVMKLGSRADLVKPLRWTPFLHDPRGVLGRIPNRVGAEGFSKSFLGCLVFRSGLCREDKGFAVFGLPCLNSRYSRSRNESGYLTETVQSWS